MAAGDVAGATRRLVQKAGFEAVQTRRRLSAWNATNQTVNSLLSATGETLRNRAREVIRNNPYAGSACESFVANAVGAGIKPKSRVKDAAVKAAIHDAWATWTDEADADGATDFYGLQALAARAMFEAGEMFPRFRPRLPIDGLSVPLQIQLLEADMVPLERNDLGENGRTVRCGIEYGPIGNRTAYHVRRSHPGDTTIPSTDAETVPIPASEMLHLYQPLRPGQIRGVPWVARSLVKLYLLDQYDDAELDRKKTAAMFAGFITKNAPADDLLGETGNIDDEDPYAAIAKLEPATMQVLLPGEDIKFSEPADVGGSYEAFQYRTLAAICAGTGIPYTNVTGDLRQANYSSLRAGLVEFRRRIEQIQFAVLVFQFCRPIWARWMDTAVLSGALDLPDYRRRRREYLAVDWLPPRFEWVDPEKDANAEILQIQAGLKSRAMAVSERGYDVENVDAEQAADVAREKRLGLTYQTSMATPPEPEPEPEPAPSSAQGKAA